MILWNDLMFLRHILVRYNQITKYKVIIIHYIYLLYLNSHIRLIVCK